MSYQTGWVPSVSRNANFDSAAVNVPANVDTVSVLINATAGAAPSLTPSLQWSNDGVNWADADPADVFTAIAATPKTVVKSFPVKALQFRLHCVITGSVTFTADYRWADHAT